MGLAMRHGVLFFEATGLIPTGLLSRFGVLFYDATRDPSLTRFAVDVLGQFLHPDFETLLERSVKSP